MKTQTGTAQTHSVTDSTTIEVMLSPQQMGAFESATRLDATQQHKSRVLLGAAIAAVLVVLGGVAHLAAKQSPVSDAAAVQSPKPLPSPAAAESPAAAAEPVLFKNPFDGEEVFEFPPGTTQAEARDTVAKLLLERAQGRGPDVLKLHIKRHRVAHQ